MCAQPPKYLELNFGQQVAWIIFANHLNINFLIPRKSRSLSISADWLPKTRFLVFIPPISLTRPS
jgi:hypothetical protein